MDLLFFDTSIILIYLRNKLTKSLVDSTFAPFRAGRQTFVSIVTIGELKSIALRNKWGEPRIADLENFLSKFIVANLNSEDILQRYAEIDCFSQGKPDGKPLKMSARNMGKNDLWIAATASVLGATLLTADDDFDHLQNEFVQVAKIAVN